MSAAPVQGQTRTKVAPVCRVAGELVSSQYMGGSAYATHNRMLA